MLLIPSCLNAGHHHLSRRARRTTRFLSKSVMRSREHLRARSYLRSRRWAVALLVISAVVRVLGGLIVVDPEDRDEMVREGWSVERLPSPTRDPEGCRRPGKFAEGSFVCDPDGLLTLQGAERAEEKLQIISSLRSPCGEDGDNPQGVEGGVTVVSRILPSGGGGGKEGGGVSAEGFARAVHNSWRIGKRGCDNGFLLVASRAERTFAISVGKGLERFLTPRDRNAALNAMKPFLQEGDWDSAVSAALEEINGRLRRSLLGEENGEDDEGINANAYVSLLGDGWNEMKRRASKNWHNWGGGGSGGSGGGSGGGGGGGGLFGDWNLGRLFRSNWSEVTPVSTLLALSLLWGGARARSSMQRRRFVAKLAGIAAERPMVPFTAGGWSVEQDALGSQGTCPICLDAFVVASTERCTPGPVIEGDAVGEGLVGPDGVAVATLPCGHCFCRSCLSQWHEISSSARDPRQNAALQGSEPCPICDEATPALGDPRLTPTRRKLRRSRRSRREVGSVEVSWARDYSAAGNSPSSRRGSHGSMDLRFVAPRSSLTDQAVAGQDVLSPPPPPPPPSPTKSRPSGGTPQGFPLTPVEAAPRAARTSKAVRVRGRVTPAMVPGNLRSVGVDGMREQARREAVFRLVSLGSQYPAFLNDRIVNRWFSKDYSSSWSRDPFLARSRQPDMRSGLGGDHHVRLEKGSGWVSNRSRDGNRGASSRDKKSYGGGSSSSATGGGW